MKSIQIENIDISFYKSKKAKHIIIYVESSSKARVAIPRWGTYGEALKFTLKRASWIKARASVLGDRKKKIFDENSKFDFFGYSLHFNPVLFDEISSRVSKKKIRIDYPFSMKVEDERIQEIIGKNIEKILRKEAKKYLPSRLNDLSFKYGLKFRKVFLKNSKSQWGSCSEVNNINLSIYLMRLPNNLIDYILIHELLHTVHKNHGPEFKRKLSQMFGDLKPFEKSLKVYSKDLQSFK